MEKERRTVLVTRFSALGDVAMTIPALYDACTANPADRFLFVTRPHPAKLFANPPANLEVVGVNLDNYRGVGGMRRLASALRKRYGVTHYVDLHDVLRTKLLRLFMRLAGVKVRSIRKGRKAKKELTRANNKVLVQLKPMPERYRETFNRAGIALANDFSTLWPGGHPADAYDPSAIGGPKREGEKWIAVAPFAQHRGKVYPMAQMERVVDALASRPDTRVLIFGFGEQESAEAAKMARGRANVVNMAAVSPGLAGELALLADCDVMVSMDSANMHMASLVGLRAVSVWGATHPYTGFLGWNQKTRDVVQLDMTCRPCSVFGDKPCARGDYHCLAGITPKMILDKVLG